MLFTVLLAAHVVLALLLVGVILLQQGKGATAGAAFGSGASSTVFGSRGSASFLTRLTAILAILFFSNSLFLAYLYGQATEPQSLLDQVAAPPAAVVDAPALPPDASPEPTVIDIPPTMTPADVPAIPLPDPGPAAGMAPAVTTPAVTPPPATPATAPPATDAPPPPQ